MPELNSKKELPLTEISNFRDESGVSTRRLEFGLWFIRHRKHFFIGAIIFLSLISVSTIGYSIYNFSHYLIVGRDQDEQLYKDISSSANQLVSRPAVDNYLSISEVTLLLNQNNQADFVGKVVSAHNRSVINFSYYFDVNGEQIGAGNTFVLPGDTKYVMALNQKLTSTPSGAELIITDISYNPMPREVIPLWQEYRADRLRLQVQDAAFIPGQDSGLSEKISLGELSFTIINQGGFSYKQLPLAIVLRLGDRIVSASRYYIDNFRSGEKKSVRISWPGSWSGISKIEIIPDINILDENVYLQYSSE